MMMSLGMFIFEINTASYQELKRKTSWRHPSNSRVNNTPAYQSTGKGEDTISLSGVIYLELTGPNPSLDILRNMGDTGKSYPLIEGTGKIYGLVVINDIEETKSYFFKNGSCRKIEFSINLTIVKDWDRQQVDSLINKGINAIGKFL